MENSPESYKRSSSVPPPERRLHSRGKSAIAGFIKPIFDQSEPRKMSAPPEQTSYCINCHGSHRYARQSDRGQEIEQQFKIKACCNEWVFEQAEEAEEGVGQRARTQTTSARRRPSACQHASTRGSLWSEKYTEKIVGIKIKFDVFSCWAW